MKHKSTNAKIGYGVIFVLFTIIAWFLRDYGQEILGKITIWNDECNSEENDTSKCYGKQGVLRISLSLFTFFMGMSLAMIGHKKHDPENFRTKIQDGFWPIKILLLIILIVIAYVLPNSVMLWYGYISIVGATFFVFIQILLLVDFAYDWNEKWVAKEWYKPVVASSLVIYTATVTAIILMFVWFANSASCGLNIFLVIFNVLLSSTLTYLSLRNDIQRGSLLTSSVVAGYTTFLVFSALLIGESCNPFPPTAHARIWIMAIGIVIAIISICWNTISSASQRGVFQLSSKHEDETPLISHENECYNFSYFHLVFACGAMYMAMLFTGWNLESTLIQGVFDIGPISFWIKIATSWVASILYIWSMVAPSLFPDREFV